MNHFFYQVDSIIGWILAIIVLLAIIVVLYWISEIFKKPKKEKKHKYLYSGLAGEIQKLLEMYTGREW